MSIIGQNNKFKRPFMDIEHNRNYSFLSKYFLSYARGGEMKPKNFPKRKLLRKMRAEGINIDSFESQKLLAEARNIRTKKNRSK